jgi:hypothetical protein
MIFKKLLSLKGFALSVVAMLLVWVLCLFVLIQSGSYKAAVRFVREDETIAHSVGEVLSVRLGILLGSFSFVGDHGEGHYQLAVRGNRQRAVVDVDLELGHGEWRVTKASMVVRGQRERIWLRD